MSISQTIVAQVPRLDNQPDPIQPLDKNLPAMYFLLNVYMKDKMNHLKSIGFKRGAVIAGLTTLLAGLVMPAVFVGCDEAVEEPLPDEPSALVECPPA